MVWELDNKCQRIYTSTCNGWSNSTAKSYYENWEYEKCEMTKLCFSQKHNEKYLLLYLTIKTILS